MGALHQYIYGKTKFQNCLRDPLQSDHNHAPKSVDFWIRRTKTLLYERVTADFFSNVYEVYETTISEMLNEIGKIMLDIIIYSYNH